MGMGFRHHHGRQYFRRLCVCGMASFSWHSETVAGKRVITELPRKLSVGKKLS